ncbi:la-related protein 6-like [Cololabis saira]|uniref:la-related protein 6-like n=1 Tax=Cololabis saira TaxID=129043 RepID=UPI002AD580F1|nr:la-related protein 6-like [Cololabis saira]
MKILDSRVNGFNTDPHVFVRLSAGFQRLLPLLYLETPKLQNTSVSADTMSEQKGNDARPPGHEDGENESLCFETRAQLEKMFSDSHLAENSFLLKHVLKNKHGYVSLKLLTSLKKIKSLTSDWNVTLMAAECSDLLEVNDDCTKVRRKEPLPSWLLCSPTNKFLLIWDVSRRPGGQGVASQGQGDVASQGHDSLLLKVLQRFGNNGSVASVWILHPGDDLPKELQQYAKHNKELSRVVCAVVKFNSLEGAREAFSALRAEEEEEEVDGISLRVAQMGFKSVRDSIRSEPPEEESRSQTGEIPRPQEHPLDVMKVKVGPEPSPPQDVFEEPRGTYYPQVCFKDSMKQYFEKHCLRPPYTLKQDSRIDYSCGDCNVESPWVLRRKCAATAAGHLDMTRPRNVPYLMQGVLRQPRGPDGSKGFHARRESFGSLG